MIHVYLLLLIFHNFFAGSSFKIENRTKALLQALEEYGQKLDANSVNMKLDNKKIFINSCEINGTIYKSGDPFPSSNSCEQCYCIHGNVQCIIHDCNLPLNLIQDCEPILEPGICCPQKYDCNKEKKIQNSKTEGKKYIFKCSYFDMIYHDGDLIPEESTPCKPCYCLNGEIVCAKQNCSDPMPACKPVLNENICCPVKYECDKEGPSSDLDGSPESSLNIEPRENENGHKKEGCFVEGQLYRPNSTINITDTCQICKCNNNGEVSCEVMQCLGLPQGIINCSKPNKQECCPIQRCTCSHMTPSEDFFAIPQVICEACLINGITYKPGDLVKSESSCKICYCTEFGIRCDHQIDCEIPKHVYYSQNCTPMVDPKQCCPVEYECDCTYNGQHYKPGDKINTGFPCDSCQCDGQGHIKCEYTVCERPISKADCKPKYDKEKCCPVDYECEETSAVLELGRQIRIDNHDHFLSLFRRSSENSEQFNFQNQNGRLIIPFGNFPSSQTISGLPNSHNTSNDQWLTIPHINNSPIVPTSSSNPFGQVIPTTPGPNQFSSMPNQQTIGNLGTVQQSFMVDNRPIVSISPNNGMSALENPLQTNDPTRNNNLPTPVQFQPSPNNQQANRFPNQLFISTNEPFTANSQNNFSPNIPNGGIVSVPKGIEIIGKFSNESNSIQDNRQNFDGTNRNSISLSSFRLPATNGPSSMRQQQFEIGPFGMAVIPMGNALQQSGTISNNNDEFTRPLESSGRDQFSNKPENSAREQFQNHPQNFPANIQENSLNQFHQQPIQPSVPNRENQLQFDQNLSNFQASTQSNLEMQQFSQVKPSDKGNSIPGLISETGFRPIISGIPSIPFTPPENDVRDQVIKLINPGPIKRFNVTNGHLRVINRTVTQAPVQSTSNSPNTTLNDITFTTINHTTTANFLPVITTSAEATMGTKNTQMNEHIADFKTTPITERTTESTPILLPTFPSSSGGRACRVGDKMYDDGSHVDVGNPCILCSCMDSGLWCIPSKNCAKTKGQK